MVIYHFNRIIRNRFVWGAFAVIIAFAFVSVDSCSTSSPGGHTKAGSLDGKPVPSQTYQTLERYIRQTDRNEGIPPPAMLYTQTWQRLAAAQVAAQAGIAATPALLQQEILSSGAFADGFNRDVYRYLLRQNLQLSEQEFEAGLANSITLRMVGAVVGSAAWVSPMEVDDALAIYTDTFTVQHAVVSNTFADTDLPLTESDLLRHYESHRADYALPERVAIHYVAVPISNYVDAVTVSDADVLDYYDSNSQRFTRPSETNDTAAPAVMPLEEARASIVETLKQEQAADAAFADVCHGLLEQAVAKGFETAAAARGLAIATTRLFGVDDFLLEFENGSDVIEKAFELDARQAQTRYNAVRGMSVIYLIAAFSNDVARIPAFAEVEADVRLAALAVARREHYEARVAEAHKTITAAVAEGKNFAAAAQAANLAATTNYTFTVNGGIPESIAEINTVVREAVKLRAGGISASDVPRFGNAVIVSVSARTPGDAMTAAFLRDQIRDTIETRLFPSVFAEWSAWNLKASKFRPTAGTEPVDVTWDDETEE